MAGPGNNLLLWEGPSGEEAGIRMQSFFDDDDCDEDFEPGEDNNDDDDEDDPSSSEQSDEDMEDSTRELNRELEFLKESGGHSNSSADASDCEEALDSAFLDADDRVERSGVGEDHASNQSSNECSVEHLAAIRGAYPLLSFSIIEKELSRQRQDLRKTYNALKSTTAPSLSFDEMMDRMVMGLLEQAESSPAQTDHINVFGQRPRSQKPLIEEVDSDDDTNSSTSDSSSSEETSSDDYSAEENDSDDDSSGFDDEANSDSDESSSDSSSEDSTDDSSDESNDEVHHPETVKPASPASSSFMNQSAPHQGRTRTQKRNARRKKAKLSKLQEGTITDSKEAELWARKQALLGVLSEQTVVMPDKGQALDNGDGGQTPNQPIQSQAKALATPDIESTKPRARVDMGAGRRMLFGALGLKNPKSKAEEEIIQQKLMKDVKHLNNPRIIEVVDDNNVVQAAEEDTEAVDWRSRITYRAVECCYEGMVLSEPPFPFVQRWDPQQQYGSMRKRKRQSQTYNDDSYVEEGSGLYTEQPNGTQEQSIQNGGNHAKKRKSGGGQVPSTVRVNGIAHEAVVNGTVGHAQDMDDLPELPDDLSSLAILERGAAKEGMVITWKQLSYSKETQWQPVIASVTAEVLPGGDESSLDVRLAFRDRDYKEKLYDEKTGERIYDKFEVPDFEEDGDENDEDDGRRTIAWDEMTEPRIVREVSS